MEYIKKVDLLSAAVEVEYLGRPRMMVSAAKIGTMPAVDVPDRPQGEWIEVEEDWRHQIEFWKCSECEFAVSSRYNFCPNCGCQMKGADDE